MHWKFIVSSVRMDHDRYPQLNVFTVHRNRYLIDNQLKIESPNRLQLDSHAFWTLSLEIALTICPIAHLEEVDGSMDYCYF